MEQLFLAKVLDVKDPEMRGRIKVACADLLGDEDSPLPANSDDEWVEPLFPWGYFTVPEVDDTVEVLVIISADGDEIVGQQSIENPCVRWTGIAPRESLHALLKINYGKRRGLWTTAGIIYIDDTAPGEITLSVGETPTSITINGAGQVVINAVDIRCGSAAASQPFALEPPVLANLIALNTQAQALGPGDAPGLATLIKTMFSTWLGGLVSMADPKTKGGG